MGSVRQHMVLALGSEGFPPTRRHGRRTVVGPGGRTSPTAPSFGPSTFETLSICMPSPLARSVAPGGDGNRIKTMARHANSPLVVVSYHYCASTLFSYHYLPLLVVTTHPVEGDDRPHPGVTSRTAEHQMLQVALSLEEEADYRPLVAARRPSPWRKLWRFGCADFSEPRITGHIPMAWYEHTCTSHTTSTSACWSGCHLPQPPCRLSPRAPCSPQCAASYGMHRPSGSGALKQSLVALGDAQKRQCFKDLRHGAASTPNPQGTCDATPCNGGKCSGAPEPPRGTSVKCPWPIGCYSTPKKPWRPWASAGSASRDIGTASRTTRCNGGSSRLTCTFSPTPCPACRGTMCRIGTCSRCRREAARA